MHRSDFSHLNLADRGISGIISLLDQQHLLIEKLYELGEDATSAKIVFDSLMLSLSLYVQQRHRLRAENEAQEAAA